MTAHRFIVANLHARPSNPVLVAVDAALYDELKDLPWRTDKLGRVYRQYVYDDKTLGKVRRLREYLHVRVAGHKHLMWMNLDPLDCRKENLVDAPPHKNIAAGSSVISLEGFKEAQQVLLTTPPRRGRRGRLSDQQIKHLLDECLAGFLKGESLNTVQLWVEEEFSTATGKGPTIHLTQLREMLAGRCCRLPGFDYQKLQLTRPTRQVFE